MFDFDTLGLAPTLAAALKKGGFSEPTPIQAKAIPLALEGHDILGLAQTGTGKTLAFGLPLMNHMLAQSGRPLPKTVRALVLAPTRELVAQIADSLRPLAHGSNMRIATVVGGQSINKQITLLSRGTEILVATPGRLIDLMDREAVDLSQTGLLVLDEADQMLDMGFIHALRRIAPALGTPRQTMLFSATMPKQMEELSRAYLDNPKRIQVAPPGKAADKVTQSIHFLPKGEKPRKLREILNKDLEALTLVFVRTKHGADRLTKGLVADGFNAAAIHGNKSQGQRNRAIKGFRDGEITVLVATDVAARGIDIPGVAYVVNYDLPEVPDNYVHRIGRTARAGREGEAVALCSMDEADLLRQIQKLMKIEIPIASGFSPIGDMSEEIKGGARGRGRGPRKSSGGPAGKSGKPQGRGDRPGKPGGPRKEGGSRSDGPRSDGPRGDGGGAGGKGRRPRRRTAA